MQTTMVLSAHQVTKWGSCSSKLCTCTDWSSQFFFFFLTWQTQSSTPKFLMKWVLAGTKRRWGGGGRGGKKKEEEEKERRRQERSEVTWPIATGSGSPNRHRPVNRWPIKHYNSILPILRRKKWCSRNSMFKPIRTHSFFDIIFSSSRMLWIWIWTPYVVVSQRRPASWWTVQRV